MLSFVKIWVSAIFIPTRKRTHLFHHRGQEVPERVITLCTFSQIIITLTLYWYQKDQTYWRV